MFLLSPVDREHISTIPSMGGACISNELYDIGMNLSGIGDVVECGTWFGASIVPVAMALRDKNSKAAIHCYDIWTGDEAQVAKAKLWNVKISIGEDLLPHFINYIKPVHPRVFAHKGLTNRASWSKNPIELYIDDCNKDPKEFFNALNTFSESWIPGTTIVVLMDYDYYQKSYLSDRKKEIYRCQKEFVESNMNSFELIDSNVKGTSASIFRFLKPWPHWPSSLLSNKAGE